jgi:hypothetical protein
MIAFGSSPLAPLQTAKSLLKVSDTEFVIVLQDDEVLSCQPTADGSFGSWGTRPKGTDGPWEKCTVEGNIVTFRPSAKALSFLLINRLPNG